MARRPSIWLTYGSEHKLNIPGLRAGVTSAKIASPHPWAGREIWRYRLSRNTFMDGVWTDKNPRARLFERHFFTSREEAVDAARTAALTFGISKNDQSTQP